MPGDRFKFTDLSVKALKADNGVQRDAWDTSKGSPPGFGVRVTPPSERNRKGVRTWQVVLRVYHPDSKRWLPVRKKIERVDLMELVDAREEARRLIAEAKQGADIRKSAQRKAVEAVRDAEHAAAFNAVRKLFLADCERTLRPATVRGYRMQLSYCDAWDDRPLSQITKLDTQLVFEGLLKRGKNVQANRVHASLRAFFRWAKNNDRFAGDAPLKDELPGGKETSVDRYLSDIEIGIVYRATAALGAVERALMLCLMLLGQRSSETAGMRYKELHLNSDAPIWTLPATRTKNKKAHALPLPAAVVTILQEVPRPGGTEFVFWHSRDKRKPLHADRNNAVKLVRARARQIARDENLTDKYHDDWSAHDFRRTLATGMARLGIDQHLADRVLSHSDSSQTAVAKIYQQHQFQEEARAALERWCRHVQDMAEGRKPKKVVPLKRA